MSTTAGSRHRPSSLRWPPSIHTPKQARFTGQVDSNRREPPIAAKGRFDLRQNIDPNAFGYQSVVAHGKWLYLVPFETNVLIRYDATRPLSDPGAYEKLDLKTLNAKAVGYTGAVVVGASLVLVPWRNVHEPVKEKQAMSVAARFDTQKALNDSSAWEFFDVKTVDAKAGGYQFGWIDRDGFVFFSPTNDFRTASPPPFVVWDSAQPFSASASWKSFSSAGMPLSTGPAYDGRFAYIAPYGINGFSGKITRVSTHVSPQ